MSDPTPDRPPLATIPGGDDRPEIVITTEEHSVADKVIAALADCPEIYQRGGRLVHVVADDSKLRGIVRGGLAPRIADLPQPRLRELMSMHVRFLTRRKKKDGDTVVVPAHPPEWLVRAVLARGKWPPGIRPLAAIVEAPVMRPDGTVLDVPGYDAATGLLYLPAIDFGSIAAAPTQADALRAIAELKEVIADFPFSGAEHLAACIACMITPLARYAYAGQSPLFVLDANTRGAGKTLICDVAGEIATGRPMARMSHPEHDEEFRKRITAIAIGGDPMVLIDNIVGALGCASLDAALTAPTWKDRVLGKSEMTAELPMLTSWYASGNNVQIVADTARRILHIRLDSPDEKPEERGGFRHPDLVAWVRVERARLVRAALTVLRAYAVAGRPAQPIKPWGSFESWSALVRAALVWLGEPDPGLTRAELIESADTEASALRMLVNAWGEVDEDGAGITAAELLSAISTPGDRYQRVRDAITELVPTYGGKLPSTKSIGRRLRAFKGRVVDGKRLHPHPNRAGTTVWSVRQAVKE